VLVDGMICRASRAGQDFEVERLGRACAARLIETEGFLSAEICCDPSPEQSHDEELLKQLDKEVRRLVGELLTLLPENEVYDPISPHGGLIELFNLQDIVSPSHLADHTGFLLHLLGLISTEKLREFSKIFRPDDRLQIVFQVLTKEVETKQLEALLLRRMGRYYPTRPLLPQKFLDKFNRESLPHIREFYPNVTALSRRQYIANHLLQAVDIAIELLHVEAETKAEQDRREIHVKKLTSKQSQKESRKARKESGKTVEAAKRRYGESVSRRLGRSDGRPQEWGGPELSGAIDRAMDEVLRQSNGLGIDYSAVADRLKKLYPSKNRLSADALKGQVRRHGIDWMEKKKNAQSIHKLREERARAKSNET
jgi:hypothetical protein